MLCLTSQAATGLWRKLKGCSPCKAHNIVYKEDHGFLGFQLVSVLTPPPNTPQKLWSNTTKQAAFYYIDKAYVVFGECLSWTQGPWCKHFFKQWWVQTSLFCSFYIHSLSSNSVKKFERQKCTKILQPQHIVFCSFKLPSLDKFKVYHFFLKYSQIASIKNKSSDADYIKSVKLMITVVNASSLRERQEGFNWQCVNSLIVKR